MNFLPPVQPVQDTCAPMDPGYFRRFRMPLLSVHQSLPQGLRGPNNFHLPLQEAFDRIVSRWAARSPVWDWSGSSRSAALLGRPP